jgi:hypothetical protein
MTAQQARVLKILIARDRLYRSKVFYQVPVEKKDMGVAIGVVANRQTADSLVACGLAEVRDFDGRLYVCLKSNLGN